jgi:NADH-quinone oxidoreductase subunit L
MTATFWLAPFVPALSALALFLFGGKLGRKWIALQSCLAVLSAFLLSAAAVPGLLESGPVSKELFAWISAGSFSAGAGFMFDRLSAVMTLVVTGVGFLIHVFSVGYMRNDRSPARYFGLLNLFTAFMLVLVLASDLVLMFVGWEGVGLCSYLLIGFWFERPAAAAAGKKAFLVNRVGDAAFLVGSLLILTTAGGSSFGTIHAAVAGGAFSPAAATLAALLLFAGATGKSAQVPLYVWLPDAMEGPTPVSALIHAATMVTAGVYLVCRMSPLFAVSATASAVVAATGAATALLAATMALAENDIKRVLAYSTISQIGYMFIGCGVGAYAAGMFHLVTHAFFKSLLFLAAGSVIHALSGVQDVRKMGGLRKYLPRTFPAFLIGAAALSGVPFLSGFFSKDAILSRAYAEENYFAWAAGLATAVITALYMFRVVILVFYGRERLPQDAKEHIHESPPIMTVPLQVLAFFAAAAGFLGLPAVFVPEANVFSRFLGPAFPHAAEQAMGISTEWGLLFLSTAAALAGIAGAYVLYVRAPGAPAAIAGRFPRATRALRRKYYVDEFYRAALVTPVVRGSEAISRDFDLRVVDGAVNGSAAAVSAAGRWINALQTGLIRDYALAFLLGAVLFLGFLLM